MEFIIKIIITPIVLIVAAKAMNSVYIKDTRSAIITSIAILVVGFLIGWLITFLLNLMTLGILWIIGLGIITRTIAYAIVIEIIDQVSKGFDTKGFLPSLWLSVLLAISWAVVEWIF